MIRTKNILSNCKRDLIDIYKSAIESVKPERLISGSIKFTGQKLTVQDSLTNESQSNILEYDLSGTKVHVIGGGKSVLGMAVALSDLVNSSNLQQRFASGAISIPKELYSHLDGSSEGKLESIGIRCLPGSKNNLPCENSVEATDCIMDIIEKSSESDRDSGHQTMFIVLISGGGSACLTNPRYVTLDRKLDLINSLVQKGANIVELNTVRRHYSNVKGGRLAQHILKSNPKSKILTLIVSDVIGDPVEFIASGPTYIDSKPANEHEQTMNQILQKYGLRAIPQTEIPSGHNEGIDDIDPSNVVNRIIGSNKIALQHAMNRAKCLGYEVNNKVDNQLDGSTSEALQKLIKSSLDFDSKSPLKLTIAGGETVVKKLDGETWGIGGRLQEMCLDYMISGLRNTNQSVVNNHEIDILLAGSTDGQDGPTDVAACLASHRENELFMGGNSSLTFGLDDCLQAKNSHDSFKFWSNYRPDWLVRTGLTGTNVMDLYFHLRVST